MAIVNTKHYTHLSNFILCDIYDRNIDNTVCDFYQRSHGLINEFRVCDCITLIIYIERIICTCMVVSYRI